ncbi:MAG TPA: calcium-binding protein [Bryobacteraceae bacterium]|nr:calcium-binding protein [Bryobacteraceae bacterium]
MFWENVVRVIDNTIGVANLSGGDETALDDAIYDSDNSLSLAIILSALEWDGGSVTTWNGTSGDDTYTGGAGMDTLNGGYGIDTLNGSTGADRINGESGNDILDGQSGDDFVQGGAGNDTYKYTAGHGWDTFEEYGTDTGDKILFASGVAIGDLTISRVSSYDMLIEVASGVGGGQILIRNQFNTNQRIESLEFAGGGSPYNLLTQTAWTLTGTDGDDQLWGVWGAGYQDTIYGGDGDDTIYAYAANHTDNGANFLYGEDGDDILDAYYSSGADTLRGGEGNDTATGGGGSDIYIYDTGHDTYNEVSGTADEIQLAAGIVSGDITYARIRAYDLLIEVAGEGSITIKDFYYSAGYRIETLRFSDTSTVNLVNVTPTSLKGTQGADTIGGANSFDDVIYGFGGNDQLSGNSGNDTLYGGDGNDTLYGGLGNDYNEGGAGNDTMEDTSGGNDTYVYSGGLDSVYDNTGTEVLRLTGPWTVNDLAFSDLGSHHKITITASTHEIQLLWVDYSSAYLIETIEFADGFTTSLNTWKTWNNGTGSGETLNGTASADTIIGFSGNDTLNGSDGNDAMHGGADDDTLNGGNGADLLHGGTGADTLNGNDGLDTLYGGDGADIFLFDVSAFNNIDNVKDFNVGQNDALDIADILTGYSGVEDINEWVSFTNSGGNTQVFVDRDGTGGTYSAAQIALLHGVVDLDADDLLMNGNLIAV